MRFTRRFLAWVAAIAVSIVFFEAALAAAPLTKAQRRGITK